MSIPRLILKYLIYGRIRERQRVQLQAKFVPMNGTDEDDNGMYEIIQREITNLKSLSHNQRKTLHSNWKAGFSSKPNVT